MRPTPLATRALAELCSHLGLLVAVAAITLHMKAAEQMTGSADAAFSHASGSENVDHFGLTYGPAAVAREGR